MKMGMNTILIIVEENMKIHTDNDLHANTSKTRYTIYSFNPSSNGGTFCPPHYIF